MLVMVADSLQQLRDVVVVETVVGVPTDPTDRDEAAMTQQAELV